MDRARTFSIGVALCGALVIALAATALLDRRAPRPHPNVLLVSIDSLRHDHLGYAGYHRPTSPAIDALAAGGAHFRQAVSPSSWTLPAHVTLLTAKPPEQHGVVDPVMRLDPGTPTLADALAAAGYATAGFVAAPFLESLYGYAGGFALYDESVAQQGNLASHTGVTSPALVAKVSSWLRGWSQQDDGRPFFVFLHMWDVHYDYAPPPPYDTMFDPDYRGSVDGTNFELGKQVHAGMDRRDLEHVIALYDGEIRYTDEHLGQIVALLRQLGELDDTLIVVTSDHGEEFFEHGAKGHGKSLYDETIRVPLVMHYPRRIAPGTRVDAQVRLMDVAPTILGLARVAAPADFGAGEVAQRDRDLAPWLTTDAESAGDAPFPELIAFSDLRFRIGRPIRATRTVERKTIVKGATWVRQERYDLIADPGEKSDLVAAGGPTPAFAPLTVASDAWLGHWAGREVLASPATPDRAHVERLRALGYVE